MLPLKIKKLSADVQLPSYAKQGDCGLDIRANGQWINCLDGKEIEAETLMIMPGERIMAKTGLCFEIPQGHWGNIRDRSGLAANHGLHVLAGVIDESYRGELMLVIINLGKKPYEVKKGDRLAQMIISPYALCDVIEAESLTDTSRAEGGFGHTGRF